MENVVDSKKTKLGPSQIVMHFAEQYSKSDLPGANTPVKAVIAGILKEITMPNTDLEQFGNTAFIGHRGKGENKNAMAGRALNVDTANNFSKNGLEYMESLRKKGIEYYRTDFYNKSYLSLFRRWHKTLTQRGDNLDVMNLSDGGFRAFIVLKPEGDS